MIQLGVAEEGSAPRVAQAGHRRQPAVTAGLAI